MARRGLSAVPRIHSRAAQEARELGSSAFPTAAMTQVNGAGARPSICLARDSGWLEREKSGCNNNPFSVSTIFNTFRCIYLFSRALVSGVGVSRPYELDTASSKRWGLLGAKPCRRRSPLHRANAEPEEARPTGESPGAQSVGTHRTAAVEYGLATSLDRER